MMVCVEHDTSTTPAVFSIDGPTSTSSLDLVTGHVLAQQSVAATNMTPYTHVQSTPHPVRGRAASHTRTHHKSDQELSAQRRYISWSVDMTLAGHLAESLLGRLNRVYMHLHCRPSTDG